VDNAASFAPLASSIDEYYIVAIDMTGHGLSSHRSAGAHYHLTDFVNDIHELVESQAWSTFIIMGHSMGGIIATLYTSCFPEHIEKLISIESFGPMTKEAETSPVQLKDSILDRLKAQKSSGQHPKSIERTVQARAKAGDITLDSARLLVLRNIREQDGQLLFTTDRRLRTFSSLRMTHDQAEAFMCAICCPVLLISGSQGYESMRKVFEKRTSWLKDLKVVQCEGHHHVHMDNPSEVSDEIVRFLNDN
jgi:pimeloyl-ACP methyl ester carboxylesterase